MESVSGGLDEAAFLDGTHSALVGGKSINSRVRPESPTSSYRDCGTESESEESDGSDRNSGSGRNRSGVESGFSAIDDSNEYGSASAPVLRNGLNGAMNTGPKGVIADFNAFQLDSSEEENTLLALRAKRLAQLKQIGNQEENKEGTPLKYFGHLREIDFHQFLFAIEESNGIAVILHIYDPSFPACQLLNSHLSALARDHVHTKFLRALATELDFANNIESVTLPTILIYRFGELESSLIGVHREWGKGSREEVLQLLIKYGAITAKEEDFDPEDFDDSD